ncbi:MAG TPA: hypothetical protein VJ716_03625 [Gaiellaceae bacterium]|nr:hypothetical protein [Gaiellaceae bacterium]
MSRKPELEDLIDAGTTGAERRRLEHVHELLVQAGPPPELTPELRKAPMVGVVPLQVKRRAVKRRAFVLLAAALSIAVVFAAGYAIASQRGGQSASPRVEHLVLKGTSGAPGARATLDVWQAVHGNVPMTLTVSGLRKLAPRSYYDVYLVRDGRVQPWGICGAFTVGGGSRVLTLNFSAPYPLQKGDTWVVTRPGAGGTEPGRTVLRPVST